MRVTILRTTGAREVHTVSNATWLAEVKALIDCATFDTVTLTKTAAGAALVMLVDDDGYEVEEIDHGPQPDPRRPGHTVFTIERRCVRAKKPVNVEATRLYHAKGGDPAHAIVGDVALLNDQEVP